MWRSSPKAQFCEIFIPLRRGADVIVDGHAGSIVHTEVADQATAAAENIQPHQLRVILVLTKPLKNTLHIIGGRVGNGFQVILLDICRTETEHPVDNRLVHGGVMRTHDILPHGQQALVCTVFLRKHIPGNRLFVIDEHDVHRTVSDIADHVYAPKVRKPVGHRRKALWEHIHAYDLHMVGNISEREVHGFVLQEIVPELVPLTTDPSKRKTCRNSDFAAGHFSDIQFPCDGRKRQHIVVQIFRLAQFYERAGRVITLGSDSREGALSVIGAVSPPGGDISEPVSQATLRIVKVFWGLDANLAYKRHFPAVNWLTSYSLYVDTMANWFNTNVAEDWMDLRARLMRILQDEAELEEIVKLVGMDALSAPDRLKLEAARSIREDFLHQNAFHETDTYTSLEKQHDMMLLVVHFYDQCVAALDKGAKVDDLIALPVREKIGRFKYTANDRVSAEYDAICAELSQQIDKAIENKEDF